MQGTRQRTITIGGGFTVRLTSSLTGLDLTNQVKLIVIQHSKAAESKQNKQEVSRAVIRPPMVIVLWYEVSTGFFVTISG